MRWCVESLSKNLRKEPHGRTMGMEDSRLGDELLSSRWFFETAKRAMRMRTLVLLISFAMSTSVMADDSERLDFNRDIRPILSAKCFACHGPDAENGDSDFRLDTKEGAFAKLGDHSAIVPGHPEQSELVRRITSSDSELRMPPPEHKKPLTDSEVDVLKRWVQQGAPYAAHWAFTPPRKPAVPVLQIPMRNGGSSGSAESGTTAAPQYNAIDYFIASRLDRDGLTLSASAPPETLFRRLHLDLTGLPPSLESLDAFLKSPQAAAYEAAIDRLLQSPAFAERMAMEWLDVARYADTNGYSIDDHRDMWGWRDWVLHAFLTNLPYDEFIRQQLAGDLMENASERMKVATGFLRNSMNTHEGGTIPEEYRVAAIADKIDTVSTAFMGLTVKCAQCHDHKYDPLSQRDYYRFFAFFNTSAEPGSGAVNGNTRPLLEVTPILQDHAEFRSAIEQRIDALEFLKAHPEEFLGDARLRWEHKTLTALDAQAKEAKAKKDPAEPSVVDFPIPQADEAKGLSWIWLNKAGTGEFAWFRKTFALTELPQQASLFVSCDNEAVIWVNGKRLGKNPDWQTPSVFDLRPLLVKGQNLIAVAGKDWEKGKAKAALVAVVALPEQKYIGTDASWLVSDKLQSGWNQPGDPQGFAAASVVAAHGSGPWGNTFARLKKTESSQQRAALIAALRKSDAQRSAAEWKLVTAGFAKANGEMSKLVKSIDGEIGVLRKSLKSGKTTVMVMDQSAAKRQTPMLIRGQYDQHGEIVAAGIPAVFGDLPETAAPDRLALANWLTDAKHPLTARVTVNRYWQMLFGVGLVKTAEDFGSQGEFPSHPELLDWLASEFIASGWDVRWLLKTMLLSHTYRQSSELSPELLTKDPYNRLLARAPRFRRSAESIRDGALAIGGLLDERIGGPSVYPPQPTGLWKEVSHFGYPGFFSAQHFFPDRGKPTLRRSLYTFWKRTSPPPVMMAFDAPNRETCAVRRSLTNTPLQALVLMNEPQFVEASRGLARRMLTAGDNADAQIRYGFRLATARYPTARELGILKKAYERQKNYFEKSTDRTAKYLGGNDDAATAAMSTVASLILNLDETITRE